jgi:hypothetical protein
MMSASQYSNRYSTILYGEAQLELGYIYMVLVIICDKQASILWLARPHPRLICHPPIF